MKHWLITLGAPLVLAGQPLAAQDEAAQDAMAAMMGAFEVEPLTSEQQARLPIAQALVDKVMPAGTMQKIAGKTIEGFLGPLAAIAENAGPDLAESIGYDRDELDVTDEEAAEIAQIIDPVWKDRERIQTALVQQSVQRVMVKMEPAMRKGMIEAYAVNFTIEQLNDLNTFFATPTGAIYAQKSFDLASDPRIISASMSAMPEMMAEFEKMGAEMNAAVASLPEKRSFDTLTKGQKARLMELTGLSEGDLEIGMLAAQDYGSFDEWSDEDAVEDAADAVEDAANAAADAPQE